MTTTVTVETCIWPVEVRTFPLNNRFPVEGGEWSAPTIVAPNCKRTFYIHSGADIMVRELDVPD